MKPVKDALLHLIRSVGGYALFYFLFKIYLDGVVTGISPLVYYLAVIVFIEILNFAATWLMKRILGFDPAFSFKMPILVYALYRMALEFIFMIFLFTILGFHFWIVILVGLFYFFGVLRHYARLNRRMIEGRREAA